MIGVAIIGTGVISERHIEAYLLHGNRCRILALCDIFPEKAESLKEKFCLEEAVVYADYEDMLMRSDIQLVSICTPPFTHALSAIGCMRSGKHVVVEKPMASSLAECDEMIWTQKETGSFLGVISQNRYNRENRALREGLRKGLTGEVRFGQVESLWFRGHSYYNLWWRGTWEKEGGGCTLNHAVHQIDLLNWMMGRPLTVSGVLGNVAHDNSEAEDVSVAVFTYENGAVVTLTTSLVTHEEGQRMIFQCEKASLASPWEVKSSRSGPTGFPEPDTEFVRTAQDFYEAQPELTFTGHAGQIDNVLRFLETGEQPGESSDDGRLALEVITAVYQSGFTGRTVTLPLTETSPFYTRDGILANVRHFYEKVKV